MVQPPLCVAHTDRCAVGAKLREGGRESKYVPGRVVYHYPRFWGKLVWSV